MAGQKKHLGYPCFLINLGIVLCSGVRAQHCAANFRAVGSYIWWLRSHLNNERLSIVDCRDKIRAIRCTTRRFEGVQHGIVHLITQYPPEVHQSHATVSIIYCQSDKIRYTHVSLYFFFGSNGNSNVSLSITCNWINNCKRDKIRDNKVEIFRKGKKSSCCNYRSK